MKKLLTALAFCFLPSLAWAQCTGVFPSNTLCGNLSGSAQPPAAFSAAGTIAGPATSTTSTLAIWANGLGTQLGTANGATVYSSYTWNDNQTWSSSLNVFKDTVSAFTMVVTSTFTWHGKAYTFPTSGDTLGGLGTTQTWTAPNTFNSTTVLSGSSVTSPWTVVYGGTGNVNTSAHTIPINEGTSAQAQTGIGTTGQCLNGNTSADPSYGGGCWIVLSIAGIVSGTAAVSDFSSFTTGISDYQIVLENVVPVNGAAGISVQLHSTGAFQSTNYSAMSYQINNAGTLNAATSTSSFPLGGIASVLTTGFGISGTFNLFNPVTSSFAKMVTWQGTSHTSNGVLPVGGSGAWTTATSAVDGFQIIATTGNLASGIIKLYGRR